MPGIIASSRRFLYSRIRWATPTVLETSKRQFDKGATMRILDGKGLSPSSDVIGSHGPRRRRQRYGRAKRFSALLLSMSVVGALWGVVLRSSAAEAAPSQWTVTRVPHGDGATVGFQGNGFLDSERPLVETGSPPTITSVRFKGSKRNPTVVVTGTGFGSAPPTLHANCGATGTNFPKHVLYLRDVTETWDAGIRGNCIGLKIETYTNTIIKFRFGDYYNTVPYFYVLAPGDQFEFVVEGAVATGTVAYS
jgi:hypothetical protein